jgi:hypothetical protein
MECGAKKNKFKCFWHSRQINKDAKLFNHISLMGSEVLIAGCHRGCDK